MAKALCRALAEHFRQNCPAAAVVESCRRHAAGLHLPDPAEARTRELRLKKLDQRIQFVLRNPGETEADQAESEVELRTLRKERGAVQAEVDRAKAAAAVAIVVPAEAEVTGMVGRLAEILSAAAAADEQEQGLVRELLDLTTGGRIEVEQAGERKPKRGWLRTRVRFRVFAAITDVVRMHRPYLIWVLKAVPLQPTLRDNIVRVMREYRPRRWRPGDPPPGRVPEKPMEPPANLGKAHLRVARPTDDFAAVTRFYREGLGFTVRRCRT